MRRGGSIRVSFRLADPPSYAPLFISGSPNRDDRGNPLVVTTATAERRVKSYRVTLRPADRVRYVTLRTTRRARPARTDDGQGPLMRAALVALALLAATPATAGAQFGQVEPLTLRGDDDCVRTTGAPGELALPATDGVRFAQATRAGAPARPDRRAGQRVRVLARPSRAPAARA